MLLKGKYISINNMKQNHQSQFHTQNCTLGKGSSNWEELNWSSIVVGFFYSRKTYLTMEKKSSITFNYFVNYYYLPHAFPQIIF